MPTVREQEGGCGMDQWVGVAWSREWVWHGPVGGCGMAQGVGVAWTSGWVWHGPVGGYGMVRGGCGIVKGWVDEYMATSP